MRFVVGVAGETHAPHVFRIDPAGCTDLTVALPGVGSDLSSLCGSPDLLEAVARVPPAASAVPLSSILPALPVERPGKIICLGLNYAEHAREGGFEVPDYPALFVRVRSSLVAAEQPMICPTASDTFDYEAELMIVVGKGGRHIPQDRAEDHILGYTTFNDGSVRSYQRKTHQWTPGKNFDSTGAVGPIVVTVDELPADAAGQTIQTRLNGRVLQNSNTSDMIFPPHRTIAILSEVMSLEPGDLIALGTPPGVGHARRPPLWMKPGDIVEVEIGGIGVCRNPVIGEVAMATAMATGE